MFLKCETLMASDWLTDAFTKGKIDWCVDTFELVHSCTGSQLDDMTFSTRSIEMPPHQSHQMFFAICAIDVVNNERFSSNGSSIRFALQRMKFWSIKFAYFGISLRIADLHVFLIVFFLRQSTICIYANCELCAEVKTCQELRLVQKSKKKPKKKNLTEVQTAMHTNDVIK